MDADGTAEADGVAARVARVVLAAGALAVTVGASGARRFVPTAGAPPAAAAAAVVTFSLFLPPRACARDQERMFGFDLIWFVV